MSEQHIELSFVEIKLMSMTLLHLVTSNSYTHYGDNQCICTDVNGSLLFLTLIMFLLKTKSKSNQILG